MKFLIFVLLRFYVKSILVILNVQNLPFKHNLWVWILIFHDFLHFCMLKITKSTKFRAPKMAKTAVFDLINSPKLISCKIWKTEKSWNLHTLIVKANWLVKPSKYFFSYKIHLQLNGFQQNGLVLNFPNVTPYF